MDKKPTPSDPPVPVENASGSWLGTVLWLSVLVFIVYPLSIGPAVVLYEKHPSMDAIFEVLYAPLVALTENCPPLEEFFDGYVRFWVGP